MIKIIKAVWRKLKNYFFHPVETPVYSEEEELARQIKEAANKFNRAWKNFRYADARYVDIAIMELQQAELAYGLLNRKYRLLKGDEVLLGTDENPRNRFRWLFAGQAEQESKACGFNQPVDARVHG